MATTSCASCKTASTTEHPPLLCSSCKQASYCNRVCQKADWRDHKLSCRGGAKSPKAKKEDSETNKGLLFEDRDVLVQPSDGPNEVLKADTYIQRWMSPTPEHPNGHTQVIPYHVLAKFDPAGAAATINMTKAERSVAMVKIAAHMDRAAADGLGEIQGSIGQAIQGGPVKHENGKK